MRLILQIGKWFDRRLQLAAPIREAVTHPVPRSTASWWYVFGSAALIVFMLQLVTGILLALIYVPSAAEAWSSLQALNHDITLGWFIRAMHGWGSNFMVAIVLIHMMQVFLFGAYKFPRELTWIVGDLPAAHDARHGIHRSGAALRSGRVLGARHRRIHRQPCSDCRSRDREADVRWSHHRRRHAVAILRPSCLRDSRNADRPSSSCTSSWC